MTNVKLITISFLLTIPIVCSAQHYRLELSENDTFLIKFRPEVQLPQDAILKFATTVPGVYENTEYGRLVIGLRAYDIDGRAIAATPIAPNQWRISQAHRVELIEYEIDDSFGSPSDHQIPYVAGTAIENDYLMINTIGVLGFFDETLASETRLSLDLPADWIVGTALSMNQGEYRAKSFSQLANSPILAGHLDRATREIGGVEVDVFSYSSTNAISASQTIETIAPAIHATAKFLGVNPVDRYVLLMLYLDQDTRQRNNVRGIGALEHSTSSSYVLSENERVLEILNEWVAHEYFHIVTPLSLHSNNIRPFKFDRTNPDKHLWLYEGVTVWASEVLLLRDQQISEQDYLDVISKRLVQLDSKGFDRSLVNLSEDIYSDTAMDTFQFIDNAGSLAAFCMDIILLSESGGKHGLKDLLVDLMAVYGQDNGFDNDEFFDELSDRGGEKIGQLISSHIAGNEPIDANAYLVHIGYRFDAQLGKIIPVTNPNDDQLSLRSYWLAN